MAISEQMRRRIRELAMEMAADCAETDDSEAVCLLDAIERQAVEIGDALTASLTGELMEKRAIATEVHCPECCGPGRHVRDRPRELITRRGATTIAEPEYYCPCCRKAFFPADETPRR